MISNSVNIEFLQKQEGFEEVIKETLDDRLKYIDGLEILKSSQLYGLYKGDSLVGFYSVDDFIDCVEAHVYMFKTHRRYSLEALRLVVASQNKHIKTSVYGTHTHIVKFLQRLGFTPFNIIKDGVMKNDKLYDVTELLFIQRRKHG